MNMPVFKAIQGLERYRTLRNVISNNPSVFRSKAIKAVINLDIKLIASPYQHKGRHTGPCDLLVPYLLWNMVDKVSTLRSVPDSVRGIR